MAPRFGLFVARRLGTSFPVDFLDPWPHGPLFDPAWTLGRRGPRKAKISGGDGEAVSKSTAFRWRLVPVDRCPQRYDNIQAGPIRAPGQRSRRPSGRIVVADHFRFRKDRCDTGPPYHPISQSISEMEPSRPLTPADDDFAGMVGVSPF